MSKRFNMLSIALFVTLSLVACGGDGGEKRADPPSASKSAADLRVTEQQEIEIEGAAILSLSPDGKWLAVELRRVLCIYEVESLTEQSCAELETGGLDLRNIAWSPDSTRIAFTEDVARLMVESDLWVLEVETGRLTNLTDDGVTGNFIKEGVEPLLDVAPAWSPDGKTLAFVRSARTADGWEGTALYRISASGGRPEKLLSVSDEEPLTVWLGLRWSSDGKKVFYAVAGSESDDPDNGIWMVDKDGKNPQHLLGVTDPEMGPPLLIDVSAQGDKALIWYWQAAAMAVASPINVSLLELIDLETGVVEPLKQATGDEEIEFFSPRNAIFSPDGSKILYAYSDASDGTRLVVRDLEDETEHVLLTHDATLGAHFETGLGLDWADDDSVYVSTYKTGLLLSLGTE